jgi:muconate cycloisomerase
MRISNLRVYQSARPFEISFESGQAFRTKGESVILRMEYDNGTVSYGESAPRIYVTGESVSSVAGLILNVFAPLLLNRPAGTLKDVKSTLNDLEAHCLQRSLHPCNSALGAVDIALLDGLGKLEEKPVSFYLGPALNSRPAYSVSVPFLPVEQIRQLHSRFRHYPFTHIKVLLGGATSWNVERVALLRSLFGEGVDLRVEVNGKWTFEQAVANIEALKRHRISAVEQPLPARDIEGHCRLREKCGVRLVADESFCTLSEAEELVERGACDILNIKVSKCGGLLRSKAIADFAHSRNVPCQLGAHVGETEVLTAAGRHFSATVDLLWMDGGYSFLLFKGGGGKRSAAVSKTPSTAGLGVPPLLEEQDPQHWQEIALPPVTSAQP